MENIFTNFDYSKIEFDRILTEISSFALSENGRTSILELNPSRDIDKIREEHSLLNILKNFFEKEERLQLSVLYNFGKQVEMGRKGITINEVDLYMLAFSVKTYFFIQNKLLKEGYESLKKLFNVKKLGDDFYSEILKYIDQDGNIDSNASADLKRIRSELGGINEKIHRIANSYLKTYKEQGYSADDIISVREGLLCIAVKSTYKNRIDGIILDTSASGQTVFAVPRRIVELHNDLTVLQDEEKKEIHRILTEYTARVRDNAAELEIINHDVLSFDILYAKTVFTMANNYYSPEITDKREMTLLSGRHPVIGEKAVPLDIEIGKDFRILVITGPNTGGKTVVLKTIGLFVLMVQSGIPIPASSTSRFCVFRKIFIDIGDDQSIEQSLSTFSSHIKKIIGIIRDADEDSLILIDEFGTGTDPMEGASLAMSIITDFLRLGSLALMTTHYSAIKNFASQTEGVENASMEFDSVNLMPTYKLKIGIPGSSKAFEISRRLGMSGEIIERARGYLDSGILDVEALQEKLENELIEAGKSKKNADEKAALLDAEKSAIDSSRKELDAKVRELGQKIRQEQSDFLKEARKQFENIIHKIKVSNASRESIKEGKALFESISAELNRDDGKNIDNSAVFSKGDEVYVASKEVNGVVIDRANNKNQYLVQVGILKINFDAGDLRLIKPVRKKEKKVNYSFSMSRPQMTLDLRGYRYEDAEKKIEKFIEEAAVNKTDTVKIIHGKGTGALRQCIQDFLKKSPLVEDFTFEKSVQSDSTNFGVTIAKLKG